MKKAALSNQHKKSENVSEPILRIILELLLCSHITQLDIFKIDVSNEKTLHFHQSLIDFDSLNTLQ